MTSTDRAANFSSRIVQIAGTYGSGKSYVVERLIERARDIEDFVERANGKYRTGHYLRDLNVFLIGDYVSSPTWKGADTIKDLNYVFQLVRDQHTLGRHVVMEGIYLMSMKRVPLLHRSTGGAVHVLRMTTSLDVCVASINFRRAALGNDRPVNVKKTTEHFATMQSFCAKMRWMEIPVTKVSRDDALAKLTEILGCP